MHVKKQAKTLIVVSAKRPEAALEKEMDSRGIKLRWVPTIDGAARLLNSALERTIVVTELALKDGNWRDLLEAVRSSQRFTPVLLVSSSSTPELWWDALDCGVEDILADPLSSSRLCEYLEHSAHEDT